jgi:hypothetical protein
MGALWLLYNVRPIRVRSAKAIPAASFEQAREYHYIRIMPEFVGKAQVT